MRLQYYPRASGLLFFNCITPRRQDVENGNAMEACNLSNGSSEVVKYPSPGL